MIRIIALAAVLMPSVACADAAFLECVSAEIPHLDDGLSPADVITAGVAWECLSRQPAKKDCVHEECIESEMRTLQRGLLPEVLRYRAAKRATSKP